MGSYGVYLANRIVATSSVLPLGHLEGRERHHCEGCGIHSTQARMTAAANHLVPLPAALTVTCLHVLFF